ncbi:MAG: hypothetical protein AAF483_02615 [Planctomycetota bacterium]
MRTRNGSKPTTKSTSLKFHWISVNEPLDDKYFNSKNVNDLALVRRLADSNAYEGLGD